MVTNTNKRSQEFTETQQKNHQTRNGLRKSPKTGSSDVEKIR